MARSLALPHRMFQRAFTLVELLVVIALVAIILSIGVPSFRDWIVLQRLKSVNAQLATDIQFARSEAASRNIPVYLSYRLVTGSLTCYSIYTTPAPSEYCECNLGAGTACTKPGQKEIKTVSVPWSGSVRLQSSASDLAFDSATGGLMWGTDDFKPANPWSWTVNTFVVGDTARNLRIVVGPTGRPTICSTGAKQIPGYATSCT